MPHYFIQEQGKTSILVHEAPLDEKTKEIRKMFDVDEETGYPRHYNWRPLARLGPDYRPEKPFEIFEPYTENERLSTKVSVVGAMVFTVGVVHFIVQKARARPLWSKPFYSLGCAAFFSGALLYYLDHKHHRDQLKRQIYADYMKKHPERFDTVHRPKFREVLFPYNAIR